MTRKHPKTALLIVAALAAIAAVALAQGKKALDAQTLTVGAAAPAYTLPDQNGQTHTLASDAGKVVLLAFYPADFTGGCTLEAHALTAADKDLKALGVQVYGVSVQDPKSHKAFCTKEGIPYTLLADTAKTASKSYGVLIPGAGVANRVTYIVGKDGKIVYVDTNVNGHLNTCGADWVTWLKAHPEVTAQVNQADAPASLQNFHLAADNVSAKPGTAQIGQAAPSFSLPSVQTGQAVSLDALRQGKKAAVVIFMSTRCPISNGYNDRMIALANKYAAQNVAFVGIYANHNEALAECKQHDAEQKYPFPMLKDAQDKVADAYDARVTPETYVVDASGILRYHGRIDNDVDPTMVKTHDLADALDAVVAGQPVAKAHTKAFGCSIKRAE